MTIFRTSSYEGAPSANITAASVEASSIFLGSGATSATYVTGQKRGTSCGRYTGQASLSQSLAFPAGNLYWRGYVKMAATPDSNRMLVEWATDAGGSLSSLGIDTAAKIRLRDSAGITRGQSVSILAVNTWYGLLYNYNSVTGAHSARIYLPNGDFLEEVIGTGTAGTVGKNREGILQGAVTWSLDFDDTATADEILELTKEQIDPEAQGPNDPYRESSYTGTASTDLQLESGNGYYSAFDGSGTYKALGFGDVGTCGHYEGQYALRTQRISPFGFVVHWKGWIRVLGAPDTNRNIMELQTSTGSAQAAVSIDTDGRWRLRKQGSVTVATSRRRLTPGYWYGAIWTINRTTGIQEFHIHSYFGALLETLTGACGTLETHIHYEGCTQGRPTWWIDFDDTVLHRLPQTLTSPLTETASTLKFRDGKAINAPSMDAMYWNGTTLVPLEIVESF